MERVAFLIDETGQRLGCLLNPNTLEVRRLAGVRPRRSVAGPVTQAGLRDDPLLYTGGGTTELKLDLLFDVSLPGSSVETENVRRLTAPLWELAENAVSRLPYNRPPIVRFVWGKSWNIPGVVVAVAERLESFTLQGEPRRSWLRLLMLRVADDSDQGPSPEPTALPEPGMVESAALPAGSPRTVEVHQVIGGGSRPDGTGFRERMDSISFQFYRSAGLWKRVARHNDIVDPLHIPAGQLIEIPPLSMLE